MQVIDDQVVDLIEPSLYQQKIGTSLIYVKNYSKLKKGLKDSKHDIPKYPAV